MSKGLPIGETLPEVGLYAGGGLVPLLGGLGQEFHDDGRYRSRDLPQSLVGRQRLPCDVAMDPFHGIGGTERELTGQHLVKNDSIGIKVAPRIDGSVHATSLLGCHVGKRSGNDFGRFWSLVLTWKTGSNPEAGEPKMAGRTIHHNVARLDVLMNQPSLMKLAKGRRKADRQSQKPG